jgi:DNA polymerase-3 subunit beta
MKLKIKKSELSQATSRSQGAISDRSLVYLGLKAEEGVLSVSVADRVLVVYSELDAEVTEKGSAFVPARLFSDVVRELPEGDVFLEAEESFIKITAGASKEFVMKLPKIQDKEWKEPPVVDSDNMADLPAEKFQYMIDQVQFCVAQESPRNYGAVGFLHKPGDGQLRLVGTDGFRLSYSEINMGLPKSFLETGVCLSKRALNEIQRMCGEGFERIKVSISDDHTVLAAITPGYQIYVRLSSVKYPNYQGVLPSDNLTPVKISRPYLQSVIKRVLLAADKTRALQLSFSENSLTLKSRTVGTSEGKECIPLKDYEGGKRELAVNGKFLTDVFSTIGSDEVTLNIESESDPIVVVPEKEPGECCSMHVLVPIKETK